MSQFTIDDGCHSKAFVRTFFFQKSEPDTEEYKKSAKNKETEPTCKGTKMKRRRKNIHFTPEAQGLGLGLAHRVLGMWAHLHQRNASSLWCGFLLRIFPGLRNICQSPALNCLVFKPWQSRGLTGGKSGGRLWSLQTFTSWSSNWNIMVLMQPRTSAAEFLMREPSRLSQN